MILHSNIATTIIKGDDVNPVENHYHRDMEQTTMVGASQAVTTTSPSCVRTSSPSSSSSSALSIISSTQQQLQQHSRRRYPSHPQPRSFLLFVSKRHVQQQQQQQHEKLTHQQRQKCLHQRRRQRQQQQRRRWWIFASASMILLFGVLYTMTALHAHVMTESWLESRYPVLRRMQQQQQHQPYQQRQHQHSIQHQSKTPENGSPRTMMRGLGWSSYDSAWNGRGDRRRRSTRSSSSSSSTTTPDGGYLKFVTSLLSLSSSSRSANNPVLGHRDGRRRGRQLQQQQQQQRRQLQQGKIDSSLKHEDEKAKLPPRVIAFGQSWTSRWMLDLSQQQPQELDEYQSQQHSDASTVMMIPYPQRISSRARLISTNPSFAAACTQSLMEPILQEWIEDEEQRQEQADVNDSEHDNGDRNLHSKQPQGINLPPMLVSTRKDLVEDDDDETNIRGPIVSDNDHNHDGDDMDLHSVLFMVEFIHWDVSVSVLVKRLRRRFPASTIVLVQLLNPVMQIHFVHDAAAAAAVDRVQTLQLWLHQQSSSSSSSWSPSELADAMFQAQHDRAGSKWTYTAMDREAQEDLQATVNELNANEGDDGDGGAVLWYQMPHFTPDMMTMDDASSSSSSSALHRLVSLLSLFDWETHSLSAAGHDAVAMGIQHTLQQHAAMRKKKRPPLQHELEQSLPQGLSHVGSLPAITTTTSSSPTTTTILDSSWGTGDMCHWWYSNGAIDDVVGTPAAITPTTPRGGGGGTGTVLASLIPTGSSSNIISSSGGGGGGAIPVDFAHHAAVSAWHKHALEFAQARGGGHLTIQNPFDTKRMVYVTYMAGTNADDYPLTRVRINGKATVLLHPFHDELHDNDNDKSNNNNNNSNSDKHKRLVRTRKPATFSLLSFRRNNREKIRQGPNDDTSRNSRHENDDNDDDDDGGSHEQYHWVHTSPVGYIEPASTSRLELIPVRASKHNFRLVGLSLIASEMEQIPIELAFESEPVLVAATATAGRE